ncbi:unnamed protein product [Caenorhabditis auriculariae]|uniref:Major facilitator superfamily (MFS) profile domain-containing protein n=1 Tax=Caenorhabditis auriculariae TaxID=2777116 RepID=A0A8S1GZW3_9PELO|nr:unnamed protein product [Caenorhabditis auriculariae]
MRLLVMSMMALALASGYTIRMRRPVTPIDKFLMMETLRTPSKRFFASDLILNDMIPLSYDEMAFLDIRRHHLLCFSLWQFALFFCCQQIFPVFYNFSPELDCADANFTFSKPRCKLSKVEQCDELTRNCSKIVAGTAPFHSMVQDFEMFCGEKAYDATWVATIQFLGVLVGTVVYGHLGDHFGRRPVALFGLAIGIIFGVSSGLAPSWPIFASFRFIVGSSIACVLVVFYTYISEMILSEQRVFLRSFFNWGYARLVFTLVCFLCGYWRSASIATALLAAPVLPVLYFLPESPTWYRNRGKIQEAQKAEEWIRKLSGLEVQLEEDKRSTPITTEKTQVYTVRDLFTSWPITYKTLVVGCLWFSTSLSAFGSDLNSGNLAGDFYLTQFVSGAVTALAKIFVFVLDEKWPSFDRRRLHQLPQALVVLCYASIMVLMMLPESDCSNESSRDLAIVIVNIVGVSLIEVTWDACYLVAVECFPTRIRTIGIGTCSLLARIGALVAPQMAYLSSVYRPAPYAVVCGIGLVSLVVSLFFLPDTKGVDLNDVDKPAVYRSSTSSQSVCKDRKLRLETVSDIERNA